MKKLFIFLLIILLLTGCSNVQNSEDEIKLSETNIKKLEDENYQLKEENEQLQNMVANANNKINDLVSSIEATQQRKENEQEEEQLEKEVEDFLRREIDKVVVSEYDRDPHSIEIIDSSMIGALRSLLLGMSKLENDPFPGPNIPDEIPCHYDIYRGDKVLSLDILNGGIVRVNKDDDKEHFFQADPDSYLLGKAFIKKPYYVPDEPVSAKMYDSGLLMVYENSDDKGLAYLSRFRIQSVIATFLRIEKQETKKQTTSLSLKNRFVYYYFGEKLEMNVYENYIQIIEGKSEYWYSAKDTWQIASTLNAG